MAAQPGVADGEAIERVSEVVKDAACNLEHSRTPGSIHELQLCGMELFRAFRDPLLEFLICHLECALRMLAVRDVRGDASNGIDMVIRRAQGELGREISMHAIR